MFLSPNELTELTGHARRRRQIAALDEMKIPYLINPRGHLVVAREAVLARLGVESAAPAQPEPDFEAIL